MLLGPAIITQAKGGSNSPSFRAFRKKVLLPHVEGPTRRILELLGNNDFILIIHSSLTPPLI